MPNRFLLSKLPEPIRNNSLKVQEKPGFVNEARGRLYVVKKMIKNPIHLQIIHVNPAPLLALLITENADSGLSGNKIV